MKTDKVTIKSAVTTITDEERNNTFTFEDRMRIGKKGEQMFMDYLTLAGYSPYSATGKQDMYDHIDVLFDFNGVKVGVDVKLMKKLQRYDSTVTRDFHFLELNNFSGKPGWVYGKAAYIAFELDNCFVMVRPVQLQAWIDANVKKHLYARCAKEALGCVYGRPNADDKMTLIPTPHLLSIASKVIMNNGDVITPAEYSAKLNELKNNNDEAGK